jgi:hypothetical protein
VFLYFPGDFEADRDRLEIALYRNKENGEELSEESS